MKELRFPGRQFKATQKVLNGISWATYRRGNNAWLSDNVPVAIGEYLWDRGASPEVYNLGRIKYVLRELERHGFADLQRHGRRFIAFSFHSDVDIRGEVPEFVKGSEVVLEPGTTFESSISFDEDKDTGLPVPVVTPPPPPRYLADELNELLEKFAAKFPEQYASYTDATMAGLRVLVEED